MSMEEFSLKKKMIDDGISSIISLFAGDLSSKIKTIVDEKKFIKVLEDTCKSINEFISDDDVETMLSDKQLHKIIVDVVSKNGFDFRKDLETGFRKLMKQYELPKDKEDTCLMMLWQTIVQYLEKYHPDFFEREKISDIHDIVKQLQTDTNRLVQLIERQNKAFSLFRFFFGTAKKPSRNHYRVFLEKYCVSDLFVDGCTQYVKIKNESDLKSIYAKDLHKDCDFDDIVECLDTERLLCIEGNFGTGKTTLSLLLQYHLEETMKKRTYFIQANELFTKLKAEVVEENEYDLRLKEDLYLIIDSIDNIITISDSENNETVINKFAEKLISLLNANQKLHIIVNSRPFYKFPDKMTTGKLTSISETISWYALAICSLECFTVVFPIGFVPITGSGESETRINNYFYQLGCRLNAQNILQNADIKKIQPEVSNSCKTPLFAYIFGSYYYNDCDGDLSVVKKDPLAIYTDFVRKTIQGKYKNDVLRKNASFEGFFDLLQNIAIEALNCSLDKIEVREDPQRLSYGMDESNTFAIPFDSFNKSTQKQAEDLIKSSVENAGYFFINYYFFQLFPSGDSFAVKFSDNNVLYCLVAYYYFKKLSFLSQPDMNPEDIIEKAEEDLSKFVFQYQVVDFVISSISEIDDDSIKDTYAANALRLLRYAQNHAPKKFETIKMMILLSIIFLKFNRYSYTVYEDLGAKHFFKEFDWLFKAYKALDPYTKHEDDNHRFLIERYYMGAQIYNASFKRINLKHYNFKKSLLSDVEFYQCKISNTSFESATITSAKFTLCQFINYVRKSKIVSDPEFLITEKIKNNAVIFAGSKITDSLSFIDSTFVNASVSYINSDGNGRVIFENCRLSSVHFISLNNLSIEFNNCIIKDVDFFQCKDCSFEVDDTCLISTYPSIEQNEKYNIQDAHRNKIWYRECSLITSKSSMKRLLNSDALPKRRA